MNLTVTARDVLNKIHGVLFTVLNQMAVHINTWASVEHNTDGTHNHISVTGVTFGGETQTTVGAAGSASALPANPTGYLVLTIDGTEVEVPYYTKA